VRILMIGATKPEQIPSDTRSPDLPSCDLHSVPPILAEAAQRAHAMPQMFGIGSSVDGRDP
jgi:hypothetical protein